MVSKAKELVEELNRHRAEISKLKSSLNELDKEKEAWFGKKEEYSKKIREGIQKIKEDKAKRDALTKEVKELKPKRDSSNVEVATKLKDLGSLKKDKEDIAKSLDVKQSPSRILEQLERLEFKLETEPMSFDKERALMKEIKALRKAYGNSGSLRESGKKIRDISLEVREKRYEGNQIHMTIQEKAKQSQILHEEILRMSGEIDKLKVSEEDAFKKFLDFKSKFSEMNSQLKEKLKEMNSVRKELDKIDLQRRDKKKQEIESFLKSKEEEVNEKIKRGEKLTTEDLLVFQKFGKEN